MRNALSRDLKTFPRNGMVAAFMEDIEIEANVRTAEEQLRCLGEGIGAVLTWRAVYQAIEVYFLGVPAAEVKQALRTGGMADLFSTEFEALRTFASRHDVRISQIAIPAFKRVAEEKGIRVYERVAPELETYVGRLV